MKYLKKFENHTQYENYINGSSAILPNVSICTTEGDVHYNPTTPPTPVETRVVAKFNVEDTSNPTRIGYEDYISGFSAIEIDGVEQPSVVSEYTFSTTGEHTVKYTLTDPTTIGIHAFYQCYSISSCTIGSGVTSIGDGAFKECSGMTSIEIPSSVTSIGDDAFQDCHSLTSCTIGSGVTSIGDDAFNSCSGLTSVNIPSGVTSIGLGTFYQCFSLTSINIPNGVTTIDNYAFWNCYNLTSINIPNSITSIGEQAFGCCPIEDEDTRNAIEAVGPYAFDCD